MAFNRNFFDRACEWGRVAVERAAAPEPRGRLASHLARIVRHHDKVLHTFTIAIKLTSKLKKYFTL